MARPHVEFIQAQALPWSEGSLARVRPGVEQKTLSEDPDSGAATLVVHYPAGFNMPAAPRIGAAEEVLVLDGEIRFGPHHLRRDAYGYFPQGTAHGAISSDSGAVLLTFFDAAVLAETTTEGSQDTAIVIDTVTMPWSAGNPASGLKHMGLLRKVLRNDSDRQERTLLLSMAPQGYPSGMAGVQICHPCVEEMYLLSGDLISEYGIGHGGAYFWRPPQIPHGPHGSHGGAFMLIRFVQGSHRNDWTDNKREFLLKPSYQPALPDGLHDLERLGQATLPSRNY